MNNPVGVILLTSGAFLGRSPKASLYRGVRTKALDDYHVAPCATTHLNDPSNVHPEVFQKHKTRNKPPNINIPDIETYKISQNGCKNP